MPGPGHSVRPTPWTLLAATPPQGDTHTQHPRPAGASQWGLPTAHLRPQPPLALPQLALQLPALSLLPQRGQDPRPSPPGDREHGCLVPHLGPGPEPPHRASCRDPAWSHPTELPAGTWTWHPTAALGSTGPAQGSHPAASSPCQQPSLEAPRRCQCTLVLKSSTASPKTGRERGDAAGLRSRGPALSVCPSWSSRGPRSAVRTSRCLGTAWFQAFSPGLWAGSTKLPTLVWAFQRASGPLTLC